MFIALNTLTIIAIVIVVATIVTVIGLAVYGIVHKKDMNPKFLLVIFTIIAIMGLILICNIVYDKSEPAEVYTQEDVTGSYNNGYDKGYEEAYATLDEWFSNLQSVTIGDDNSTIHILDNNGEEWILVSDDYQN